MRRLTQALTGIVSTAVLTFVGGLAATSQVVAAG